VRAKQDSAAGAIVLLSGGLDSTVALAVTARAKAPGTALFFDYGQHAALREEEAARGIASAYDFGFERFELPWLAARAASALIAGKGEPPAWSAELLDDASPRSVWVENRNGIFVSIAAFYAAERGCASVVVGFNREEAAAFPDNSEEYVRRMNAVLELGLGSPVRLESPTLSLTKAEIVRLGLELDIPWRSLWSCYLGGAAMCGRCESCLRLARAVEGTPAAGEIRFGKEES
jgi:7-cyano-7-deazaguanine synthase